MPYIAMPKMACCKEINRKKNPGIVPFGVMPGLQICQL